MNLCYIYLMNSIVRFVFIFLALCHLETNGQSTLNAQEASQIIDLLSDEMRKNYLYPEKVVGIETRLKAIKQAWSTKKEKYPMEKICSSTCSRYSLIDCDN